MEALDAGGVPVLAHLPMGGGPVRGPGAGRLHVRWGVGNELRVCRTANADATRDANAAGGDADASGVSQGAAYVVQWCARRREAPSGPAPAPLAPPQRRDRRRARARQP
jgi:hypothetical protein